METKKWFVARTKSRQEKVVKKQIDELGVECYLPLREELHQWHDRKKKVEVVLIPSMVFIYAEKNVALSLPNNEGIPIRFLIDRMSVTRSLMEIPDAQMRNFMRFIDLSDDSMQIEPDAVFCPGDRIRVVKGAMAGLEGVLVRLKGVKKVIVRIEGLVACSVEIPLAHTEKIE